MMYRMLVSGSNHVVIDDIFNHLEDHFECEECSMHLSDIRSHLTYYKPHIFVYCLRKDYRPDHELLKQVKTALWNANVPFAIAGPQESCDAFTTDLPDVADMVLSRVYSAHTLLEHISKYLNMRFSEEAALEELNRRREEKQRTSALAQSEDAAVDDLLNAIIQEQTPARKHILIVDDDPVMLKTIKQHLNDEYDIATAISGKLALKFLENKHTDLVLLDYEMPGEKGPEVLEKIRANPANRHLPVIFLTGVSDRSKIGLALSMHPQGYLLKPIRHDNLIETIENALKTGT